MWSFPNREGVCMQRNTLCVSFAELSVHTVCFDNYKWQKAFKDILSQKPDFHCSVHYTCLYTDITLHYKIHNHKFTICQMFCNYTLNNYHGCSYIYSKQMFYLFYHEVPFLKKLPPSGLNASGAHILRIDYFFVGSL